jgi:transmembrane sensor
MKKADSYKEYDGFPDENTPAMANVHINWEKNKDQIWMELERKMEMKPVAKVIRINSPWLRVAVAAVFALLIGATATIKFYTKTIVVPAGLHSEVYLPDGSLVKLNAQSRLSYKPLLWKVSRNVKFEGEAFFEVTKGKSFEIISDKGETTVLGTTFNIYSRDNDYKVTCITGRVKVVEGTGGKEVILTPGQQAALNAEGVLTVESDIDAEQTLSWLSNKLSFTSVSLGKVFKEIERQYGVTIEIPAGLDNTYTGTFLKDNSVESVLNMVCKPFNLNYSRKTDNEYIISRNN